MRQPFEVRSATSRPSQVFVVNRFIDRFISARGRIFQGGKGGMCVGMKLETDHRVGLPKISRRLERLLTGTVDPPLALIQRVNGFAPKGLDEARTAVAFTAIRFDINCPPVTTGSRQEAVRAQMKWSMKGLTTKDACRPHRPG
jgi:hypothetical protein